MLVAFCLVLAPLRVDAQGVGVFESGESLYRPCAACHGGDGGGVVDGSVPAIGGQPASALRRVLEGYRSGTRQDLRMAHFTDPDHLPDAAALARVAEWVSTLRRTTPAAVGDGRSLAAGEDTYRRVCAACHGAVGAAIPARGMLALAGQHAPFLERKLAEGAAGSARHLVRSHGSVLSRLDARDRQAVADHLSRLPPP